jgi:hypothetical protein
MSVDRNPNWSEPFSLPHGMKLRHPRFGANPISALFAVPITGNNGESSEPQPEFRISWEDQQQGLRVLVREREDGHLIAEAVCTNPGLFDEPVVSVGIVGAGVEPGNCRIIPLTVSENNSRSGSADLGLLKDAVKELGPQLGVVVFPLV